METIVVDENDNVKEIKERSDVTIKDIYRVSALWLTNTSNQVLLARRAYTKKNDPGMWGPAVAGTIEKGETYESNILKEAEEELKLKNLTLKKGPKIRTIKPHNHFTQWFFSEIKNNQKIVINKKEIVEIKWFNKKELLDLINKNPKDFIVSMTSFIKLIF
jgi:isopentenyldiphosphate isomerase